MRWNFYAAIDECYGGPTLERVKEIAKSYYHINLDSAEALGPHMLRCRSLRTNLFFLFVDELHPMYNVGLMYLFNVPHVAKLGERLEKMYDDIEGGVDPNSI